MNVGQRCGIALGSNLGDRLAQLQAARDAIAHLPYVGDAIRESNVYETEPVGCPPGSPAFLNAVIEVVIHASPEQLLHDTQAIERVLGRERSGIRNEVRVVDIDLLYADEAIIELEELSLPHPRLSERLFVLRPLLDLRPSLVLPGQHETVEALHANQSQDAEPLSLFTSEW